MLRLYKYVPPKGIDVVRNLRIRFTPPGNRSVPNLVCALLGWSLRVDQKSEQFPEPNTASSRPAAKSGGGRLMPDRWLA
jgi:hypothetical protein